MYGKETIYIVGNSKTNADNAITVKFNSFFIGFVIDVRTDKIVDISCSSTIETTEEFVYSLLIGKTMDELLAPQMENEIKRRYHGSSEKAIIVACKDAAKKYREIKEKYF